MAYATARTVFAPAGTQAFFADLRARFAKYRVFRQTYAELASLSDRELSDLGISRSMIRGLAHEAAYAE